MLSPTYQVPVLYFVLRWHNHWGPMGLDAVYQYVVPKQYRQQLQSVGVMGGISFGVGAQHVLSSDRRARLGIVGFQGAHYVFVVSSRISRSGLFCPPVQHRGCHGAGCRRTERHDRNISPHLARSRRSIREPARPPRDCYLRWAQPILKERYFALGAPDREIPSNQRTPPSTSVLATLCNIIIPHRRKLPWARRCLPPSAPPPRHFHPGEVA